MHFGPASVPHEGVVGDYNLFYSAICGHGAYDNLRGRFVAGLKAKLDGQQASVLVRWKIARVLPMNFIGALRYERCQ